MIVIDNFNQVAAQIENERGIAKSDLVSAIEQALVTASRRVLGEECHLEARMNPISGELFIYKQLAVVDEVTDVATQISVEESAKYRPNMAAGDQLELDVTPPNFGRTAVLMARQVIVQRIREEEKNMIYSEFKSKVGTVVVGTVQRVENMSYLINLGKAEAILGPRDQIPGEKFVAKERIRVYIVEIEKASKGTTIAISRTHVGLLKRLFETEIPEVQDGIIEVVSVAREAGKRAKVAVKSNDPAVGAVGTCVGHLGARIQSIVKELGAEKIDVLDWDPNPKVFIANALKPAKASQVIILDEAQKSALVVVANDQLSLAIGRAGINVRLTVKLTGWKLDIINESEFEKRQDEFQVKNHVSIVDRIRQDREKEDAQSEANHATAIAQAMVDSELEADQPLRASELAGILKVKTADLIKKAADLGIVIRGPRSVVPTDQVNTLKEHF